MPQPGGAGGNAYMPYPATAGGTNFPPYPPANPSNFGGGGYPPYSPPGAAGANTGYPPYMNQGAVYPPAAGTGYNQWVRQDTASTSDVYLIDRLITV